VAQLVIIIIVYPVIYKSLVVSQLSRNKQSKYLEVQGARLWAFY